jgi:carbon storage regulator CsrA
MLCLARNEGQTIKIGPNITITVVEIKKVKGGKKTVMIGIDAPREIQILRDDAIKKGPRDE